ALAIGRSKGYHRGNRLSGSARFFYFGAHFFHLDFILAQHGGRSGRRAKLPIFKLNCNTASNFRQILWIAQKSDGGTKWSKELG
ncbi:MAG: hypothetical protein LBU16_05585, partial [Treponema sp.]|nr:hypothetical protein [Treponema sp.]